MNLDSLKLDIEDVKVETIDLSKMFNDSLLDLDVEPKRPPLAISVGVDDRSYNGHCYPLRFGTFGNISMIKGEEKSRKSFFRSLIMACSIGGKSNNFTGDLDIMGHNLEDKLIIDIDSEQDEYDSWLNAIRIPKMVGANYELYKYVRMRKYTKKERLQLLEWIMMESDFKKDIGILCIDGYVDFVQDFNDLKECDDFTSKLMKWSELSMCHITGILHLNPNSDKARGHLGTILQQKCETVVITKDMGEYSKIIQQRGRGKKFNEFSIRVNDDWLPYVSDDDLTEQKVRLT